MSDSVDITLVDNVWASESYSNEDAALKKLKAQLLVIIRVKIVSNGWDAQHVAKLFSISRTQVDYLMNGQISQFSLDDLYKVLVA